LDKENETIVDKYKKLGIVVWSIIGLTVLILGISLFLFKIRGSLCLFLYAFIVVYLLRPAVDYFQKKGMPRLLSILMAYLLLLLIIGLILVIIVPIVVTQAKSLLAHLPVYFITIERLIEDYQSQYEALHIPPAAVDLIENSVNQITDALVKTASNLPTYTINIFSFAINAVITPLFALIISFYILKDLNEIKNTFIGLVPGKYRDETKLVLRKIDVILRGFIKGHLLLMLTVGTLSWLALLVLGVDYAFILGLIIGLLDIIPYLGPIVGGVLAVLVAFFKSPTTALWVVVVMVVVQQVEGLFIAPKVMGKHVDLHPMVVMFAMIVGGTLLGIFGVLLAIPITAVGKGIFYYYLEKRSQQGT